MHFASLEHELAVRRARGSLVGDGRRRDGTLPQRQFQLLRVVRRLLLDFEFEGRLRRGRLRGRVDGSARSIAQQKVSRGTALDANPVAVVVSTRSRAVILEENAVQVTNDTIGKETSNAGHAGNCSRRRVTFVSWFATLEEFAPAIHRRNHEATARGKVVGFIILVVVVVGVTGELCRELSLLVSGPERGHFAPGKIRFAHKKAQSRSRLDLDATKWQRDAAVLHTRGHDRVHGKAMALSGRQARQFAGAPTDAATPFQSDQQLAPHKGLIVVGQCAHQKVGLR